MLYHQRLLSNQKSLRYLQERKISLATARKLCIGYFGRSEFSEYDDRLLFPVRDLEGQVLTYQGRAMFDWEGSGRPKYWHSSEDGTFKKADVLHGLFENAKAIVDQGFAVIGEGPFDTAAFMECDLPGVDVLGSKLSDTHAFLLRMLTKRVLTWFDDDEAGRKATESAHKTLQAWGISPASINRQRGLKDPAEVLVTKGRNHLRGIVLNLCKIQN